MPKFISRCSPLLFLLSFLFVPLPAHAAVNAADTSWLLVSTALVLLMTPGLAFFYAGMVRGKNAVSTLYQNIIPLGLIGVLWIVIGFSLAFSGSGAFIGDTARVMLNGVGQEPDGTGTIPYILFMAFQMMFAIITPALMTGAFAERVNFKAWLLILAVWSLAVYAPVAHWVWTPGGWLATQGALDFAGGFVVHMTAGYSALAAAILFGRRKDFGQPVIKSYDTGYVVLGTALLWFGWFGFNAGSALTSGGLAAQAFVNTFASAAVAMLAWTLVDAFKDGKPTTVGGCIGVVAGLVAVTPAAGYVTVESALLIGLLAGVLCNLAARMIKNVFKIDDSLDVFACHGVGGTIGVLMTGLLGTVAVNPAGADGLLNNGDKLFQANLIGIGAVAAYSFVATLVIVKLVGLVIKVRVTEADEDRGLDTTQHGEKINNG
jgi:Amt family ammonium transporter